MISPAPANFTSTSLVALIETSGCDIFSTCKLCFYLPGGADRDQWLCSEQTVRWSQCNVTTWNFQMHFLKEHRSKLVWQNVLFAAFHELCCARRVAKSCMQETLQATCEIKTHFKPEETG